MGFLLLICGFFLHFLKVHFGNSTLFGGRKRWYSSLLTFMLLCVDSNDWSTFTVPGYFLYRTPRIIPWGDAKIWSILTLFWRWRAHFLTHTLHSTHVMSYVLPIPQSLSYVHTEAILIFESHFFGETVFTWMPPVTVNVTGETLVLKWAFVYHQRCEENEMVFVSHEVSFPATSDRRSRVAGNGTDWEVKSLNCVHQPVEVNNELFLILQFNCS